MFLKYKLKCGMVSSSSLRTSTRTRLAYQLIFIVWISTRTGLFAFMKNYMIVILRETKDTAYIYVC